MDDLRYPEPDPNKKPVQQVWEERYAADNYLFGREPSPFLKYSLDYLKKGKAIDIGMGEGRNAVYLAKQGFDVQGIDCSPRAIEKAKRLAGENHVNVDAKVQNLDFFLMPLMKFDSIIMTYFRPLPRFFSEIRRGLVQGGTFLLEAYTTEHLRVNGSSNPLIDFDQCYKPNEVLSHLKDFSVLYYRELPDGNLHLVQVIAQKNKV